MLVLVPSLLSVLGGAFCSAFGIFGGRLWEWRENEKRDLDEEEEKRELDEKEGRAGLPAPGVSRRIGHSSGD